MLKLLIVDDEEEIRSGIRNIIDWESNSITVCGEAENGRQALSLINEFAPDIALIDIRMPIMNGLQLIEAIQSGEYHVKTVIFSGYDDFIYARQAVKFGVSDYLLKPCTPEEILATILKVKADIESELKRKSAYEQLKVKFNENLPLFRNQYFSRLINYESKYENKVLEDFELYKISIRTENITVVIVSIDNIYALYNEFSNEELELMRFEVKNTINEAISLRFRYELFENGDGIIVIANVDKDEYDQEFLPLLESIKNNIRNIMKFTITIGVGKSYGYISNIHQSYNEALKAGHAKFLIGTDSVIKYDDIPDEVIYETFYPIRDEKNIIESMRTGNIAELECELNNFFSNMNPGKLSKDIIQKSCLALVFSVFHLCVETNTGTDEIFGQRLKLIDDILKLETLDQMKGKLLQITREISKKINSRKSSNKLIEQALKFIEENYCQELSLEKVSNSLYINPRYFCVLFRQTMGINFIDYLHKTRIEKACEFLKNDHLKAYEIAYKVGYSDDKYFSQIFKKYTGMTPTQYRCK